MQHIKAILSTCRWDYLVVAALLYLCGALGGGFVWLYLLRRVGERHLRLWPVLRLTLLGFVFNNLVPGGVAGDVYRALGAVKCNVPAARAAATVILERWSSLLAMLLATIAADIWALPLLRASSLGNAWAPAWVPEIFFRFDVFMSLVLAAVTVAFLSLSLALFQAVRHRERPQGQISAEAQRFGVSWQALTAEIALFLTPAQRNTLWKAALLNTASPLLEGLSFAWVAQALGLHLSPFLFLAFTPIFRLVSHLPISINAIGPQEFVSLMLWEPLGASYSDAVTISLIIHALKIGLSILGTPLLLIAISPSATADAKTKGAPPSLTE